MKRCAWVPMHVPEYVAYHDDEWGVPVHDDRVLFEFLTLEGAQAGLSWLTILRKREGYRAAFDDFDVAKVARYTPKKVEQLLADPGIVRNRLKVESTVNNAQRDPRARRPVLGAPVVVRRWRAEAQPLEDDERDPRGDGGVEGDVEGAEAARLPVRRTDGLLLAHAGGAVS